MNDKTHKPGIHENYLVSRHLKLEGLDKVSIDALMEKLTALPEVDDAAVTMSGTSMVLNISYDASTRPQPLEDIRKALTSMGVEFADGWWNRFKQRYYATTDQNVYDNARHEPSCCSKVPPGK